MRPFVDCLTRRQGGLGRWLALLGVLVWSAPAWASGVNVPIMHWKTSHGVPVYFVAREQVPMVDIRVLFDAGSARDGSKPGLAQLTNAMLDQGTKQFNVNQIAEQFDSVGAEWVATVTRDTAVVGVRSLTRPDYLNRALASFRAVLGHPSFPEKPFKMTQAQLMNALRARQQSPRFVASQAFAQALYGNQPYGHAPLGTLTSVPTLSREDVKRFYNRYYVAHNAQIVIVGQLSQHAAKQVAERIASDLKAGEPVAPFDPVRLNKPMRKAIVFPSTQTHVYLGQVGIAHSDPDYFSLMVGNTILGGNAFTSRLFKEVRGKKGLVYHVMSAFVPLQAKGPFVINLQTRTKKTHDAIKLTKGILSRFVRSGPTQKELTLAKQHITRGFVLHAVTNQAVLAHLMNIAFYRLPLNYLNTYVERVNRVSLQKVRRAFRRTIQPQRLVVVTVGRRG